MTGPIKRKSAEPTSAPSKKEEKKQKKKTTVSTPIAPTSATETLANKKIQPIEYELTKANPEEFRTAIFKAKSRMEEIFQGELKNVSKAVYIYPEEEYKNMRLFLLKDHTAGFAVTNSNDIVSVFKHPEDCPSKNITDTLFPEAIKQGGKFLDCFHRTPVPLASLYSKFGFIPVAKVKFDPEAKPTGWDTEIKDGEPDVIFMVYNETFAKEFPLNVSDQEKKEERIQRIETMIKNLKYTTTYDQAKTLQRISSE